MPQPIPFAQEEKIANTAQAPSGMRAVGVLRASSRRARWENALFAIPFLFLQFSSDAYDPKTGSVDTARLGFAVLGVALLGAVAVAIPALVFRNNSITLTLERPNGQRIRVATTSRELASRLKEGGASTQGSFRPQVIGEGRVQVELRSNWKGQGGWLVFVPEDVSEADVEAFAHKHLPTLAEKIEHQSRTA